MDKLTSAQLAISVQVLLIKDLENGVKQTRQWRIACLLDNLLNGLTWAIHTPVGSKYDYLRAGLLGSALRDHGGHAVHVHDILGGLLVAASEDEVQLGGIDSNGLDEGCDNISV